MGCSSVCSTKACRTGADSGFGGMSRLRLPSQMPAISVSGPRFLRVLMSMLDGSVKMSPGLRILQFLSTGHFVSSKLVARNLEREEARANAPGDCLGAGAHAQLREHRGQVVFHRVSGEIELRRDFLVPQALRNQPKHVQLARRECRSLPRHGGRRRGGDHPLAHHHIGFLRLGHEHDLPICLDQRRQPASRDRIGHVEVDAQLHVSPESRRSTSGAGTPSATPDTTIAATPITRPCASASGPPEFPGARRTSAWIQTSEPLPFSPYPRGNGLTVCSTPTLTASLTPNGWPTAKTREPDRRAYGSPARAAGTPAPAARTTAISRSASRRTTSPGTARPSGVTIVAWEVVTTCALVTNKSPDQAMAAPPAARRPLPPFAIPTTLARSRSAGSLRNAALMIVIALCVAARR